MLKFVDYAIVMQEIPDEITLAVEISNCPHKCPNCHSPHLREDIGIYLTDEKIKELLDTHPDITCFCLMGGDSEHSDIIRIAKTINRYNPMIKVAMYSGDDYIDGKLAYVLDYYKVGSYQEDKGPLNNPNTNQRLYQLFVGEIKDITHKFQK